MIEIGGYFGVYGIDGEGIRGHGISRRLEFRCSILGLLAIFRWSLW